MTLRLAFFAGSGGAALLVAGCSIYDSSLLGTGGAGTGAAGPATSSASVTGSGTGATGGGGSGSTGGATSSNTSSSGGGTGGMTPCNGPGDCAGTDTDCTKITCTAGMCGTMHMGDGVATSNQSTGDCKKNVCDGAGNEKSIDDDGDLPTDGNDCTDDTCAGGVKTFTPKGLGASCNMNGGKKCTAGAVCVECLANGDCTVPKVCNALNACVSPACDDNSKNGAETDVDCGGGGCPKCMTGDMCLVNGDCVGNLCTGGMCAPSCSDGLKNNAETDTDCGGGTCAGCGSGKMCGGNGDCLSGKCAAGVCADVLLISEIQTRGDAAGAAGNDEFVEIYNPTDASVTFDNTWTISGRSAAGTLANCGNNSLTVKITGGGQVIGPHKHLLFTNSQAYNGPVAGDATYASGFGDGGSMVLKHAGVVVDALCFYFNATSQTLLASCPTPYICEGAPISNAPHTDTSTAASNVDKSIERKPGGAAGNGQDTDDTASDFVNNTTSNPQNLMSPATP